VWQAMGCVVVVPRQGHCNMRLGTRGRATAGSEIGGITSADELNALWADVDARFGFVDNPSTAAGPAKSGL